MKLKKPIISRSRTYIDLPLGHYEKTATKYQNFFFKTDG